MRNGDRNLVKEAVADANKVRKMAESAAMHKIVEGLAPSVKAMVEKQIKGAMNEDTDRVRRGLEGRGENPTWEEGKDRLPEGDENMEKDKELEKESLGLEGMFPGIQEMGDEDDMMGGMPPVEDGMAYEMGGGMPGLEDEMPQEGFGGEPEEGDLEEYGIPTLGEAKDDEELDEDTNMDEEISIDEEALQKAYEGIMKTHSALSEASVDWSPDVTSGFKDSYPASEWDTKDGAPPSDRGLEAKEKQNADWDKERPTKAQDYSVKEAIKKGMAENAELRRYVTHLEEQVNAAHGVIKNLKEEVTEVNLFNTKVLHVNEMLSKFGKKLTNEQKKIVIEKIDTAETVREVKMVAESLKAAFGTNATPLREGARRSKANASRTRRSGSPDQKVLRESVDRNGSQKYGRWQQLAGLLQ